MMGMLGGVGVMPLRPRITREHTHHPRMSTPSTQPHPYLQGRLEVVAVVDRKGEGRQGGGGGRRCCCWRSCSCSCSCVRPLLPLRLLLPAHLGRARWVHARRLHHGLQFVHPLLVAPPRHGVELRVPALLLLLLLPLDTTLHRSGGSSSSSMGAARGIGYHACSLPLLLVVRLLRRPVAAPALLGRQAALLLHHSVAPVRFGVRVCVWVGVLEIAGWDIACVVVSSCDGGASSPEAAAASFASPESLASRSRMSTPFFLEPFRSQSQSIGPIWLNSLTQIVSTTAAGSVVDAWIAWIRGFGIALGR